MEQLSEPMGEEFTEGADTSGIDPDPVKPEMGFNFEPELLDLDENGVMDSWYVQVEGQMSVITTDLDGDGAFDTAWIDTDGDGVLDVSVTEDGGQYRVDDLSGTEEPVWLSREELTEAIPELVALLDSGLDTEVSVDTTLVIDGQLVGDPAGDSQYWFEQAANGFCLPASIAQIVAEYTGQPVSDESEFVEIANELGVFSVGMDGVPGVTMDGGVAILNEAGVPARLDFGDLDTLSQDLTAGYNIIVAIDSGEIWSGEAAEDNAADHAVVVTGINYERGTVILSDPGTPGGNFEEVPIDLFMNAWSDSDNAMIVCDTPPSDFTDTPVVDEDQAQFPADPNIDAEAGELGASTGPAADGQGTSFPLRAEGLPDLLGGPDSSPEPLEAVISWATANPWILLAVAIPVARLIAK
ncbi:hypothetical protein [Specibacter sp. NPDC078709]|uniref:hypothetical protein n=1 Tax=Specibacter sp. NPDC078709 TaxID=3154364 RepID=UPI00341E9FC9